MNSLTAQDSSSNSLRDARAAAARWRALPVVGLLLAPTLALSETRFTVRADGQYADNSNIFYLPEGVPTPYAGESSRGDSYTSYGAGLNAAYTWSRQTFSLDMEAHEYRYSTYQQLDHDQYRITGDWQYHLSSLIDGAITVNRNRDMVAFADLVNSSQLSIQTNQNEHATFNVRINPRWRLETGIGTSTNDSPRPGEPELRLKQDTLEGAVRFLGRAAFSAGVAAQYSDGSYDHASVNAVNPTFHQVSEQFVMGYSRSEDSIFNFNVGYTSRSSSNELDNTSATTGLLSYQRRLTGKTRIKLDISRGINSYISNTGAEIDTSGTFQVDWQATHKLAVSANYSYTYSKLPGQGLLGDDRTDRFRRTEVNLQYQVTKMFQLQPFARLERRRSDLGAAGYNADLYGIYANLRWQSK